MANTLPILRGTTGGLNAQVLYPFSRSIRFTTKIVSHANGSEQRFACHPPLNGFELSMSNLSDTDRASWLTFIRTVKGMFAKDLSLTLDSTTYSDLTVNSDVFEQTNQEALLFDQQISLSQVKNYPWSSPTLGAAFPTLSFGGTSQRPFVQVIEHQTGVSENPNGPRMTFAWFGGGLTGYPTTGLKGWRISYPLLTSADMLLLETHFQACMGRWATFSYTDPLTLVSSTVRFNNDELRIRYLTKNQCSTEIQLKEVWGE